MESVISIHFLFPLSLSIIYFRCLLVSLKLAGHGAVRLIHSVLSVAISRAGFRMIPHDYLRVAFQPEAIAITSYKPT